VEATATAPSNGDRVCDWQEEMRRALRRSESLPPAACEAIARLLERFLDEGATDDGCVHELRAAIALLMVASRRNNSRFGSGQKEVDMQRG
jgi:hypothetical protein